MRILAIFPSKLKKNYKKNYKKNFPFKILQNWHFFWGSYLWKGTSDFYFEGGKI
jgi:hypothetical protein